MNDFIADLKASLRKDALSARRELEDRGSRFRAIANRLFELPAFNDASAILTYVSKDEEVDTRGIIARALEQRRQVLVPRGTLDRQLDWIEIDTLDDLAENNFGVMEPPDLLLASPIPAGAVALVPGVAFDRTGNRLGWGHGYFDRFLAEFEGTSIGMAFDCQLYEDLPAAPHDRPVSFVVTEHETITTSGRRSP